MDGCLIVYFLGVNKVDSKTEGVRHNGYEQSKEEGGFSTTDREHSATQNLWLFDRMCHLFLIICTTNDLSYRHL